MPRLSTQASPSLVAIGALILSFLASGCHSSDLRHDAIFKSAAGAVERAGVVRMIEVDGWNADLRRWTLTSDQAERARRLFSSPATYTAVDSAVFAYLAIEPTFRLEFDDTQVLIDSCAMVTWFKRAERWKRLSVARESLLSVVKLLAKVAGREPGCLGEYLKDAEAGRRSTAPASP